MSLLTPRPYIAYRSPSVDDFISDDSETRSRKRREGKQKKRERRHEDSDDEDRDLENEYRSTQKTRIENRQPVELPEIGIPYSSEGKVRNKPFCQALDL
jgi:RNA polymerase-associated protein LEO1